MSTPSGMRSVSVEHAVAFGLLTALGLYAFVVGLSYGLFNEVMRVGPGLVPTVVGAGIALIAGWELVATLRGRRASHTHGIAEVAASLQEDVPAAPTGAAGPPAPLDEATAGGAGTVTRPTSRRAVVPRNPFTGRYRVSLRHSGTAPDQDWGCHLT